ncbi:hypothetical protein OF83DRAFT_1071117, partial [Amylostereum chailletii]
CHNYRARNKGNLDWQNLNVTGVIACCCARHGCIVSKCIAVLQKGEKQKNVDYIVHNTLHHNMDGIQRVLLMYDIMCQYGVYVMNGL